MTEASAKAARKGEDESTASKGVRHADQLSAVDARRDGRARKKDQASRRSIGKVVTRTEGGMEKGNGRPEMENMYALRCCCFWVSR